jgi:hypothetical protein
VGLADVTSGYRDSEDRDPVDKKSMHFGIGKSEIPTEVKWR